MFVKIGSGIQNLLGKDMQDRNLISLILESRLKILFYPKYSKEYY
jgi:hypothetical protein